MFTKLFSLVSLVILLSFTSITCGIQLGDFENPSDPNHDGWIVVNDPNIALSYNNTIGATLGSSSLRIDAAQGYQLALEYSLIDNGLVDEFRNNLKISIDVTRIASEWTDVGGSWCEFFVAVQAGSSGDDPNDPNDPSVWDFWDQLDQEADWGPADGNAPINFTYDYSTTLDQIDFDNLEYLNLVLCPNWGGYDPGGIYYIDNIQMFGGGPAYGPIPADGEREVPRSITLNWTSGVYADKHDIYFGTSLNDVNNADRDNPLNVLVRQDYNLNTFNPGSLVSGKNYYWRIDEVNGTDIWKGPVWTFTTEYGGVGVIIGDWEDSMDGWVAGQGSPTFSYSTNGATLNDKSLQINVRNGWFWIMTLALSDEQLEDFKVNDIISLDVTWITSEWEGATWGQVQELSINGEGIGWNQINQPINDTSNPDAPGQWNPSEFGETDTRTITWDYSGVDIGRIPDGGWCFLQFQTGHDANPATYYFDNARLLSVRRASDPSPADKQTDVRIEPMLRWLPGRYAVTRDVYIGTDFNDVKDVNTANLADFPNVTYGTSDVTSYQPGRLEFNTNYYWRVDEVNDAHPEGLWKGYVWSFTTGNYIVVDDFEAYNDLNIDQEGTKRIYLTWADGYDNPSINGSTIGYPDPYFPDDEHFVEVDIVHGGDQSTPLLYDNSIASYSEVTVNTNDLTVGPDWTRGGVQVLRLWFYGDPNNAVTEQFYVKLNNTKILYDGDAANLAKPQWTQWDIDLSTVGVNLTNVAQFGIGLERIGASRGSGMLFVDDIRLCRLEQ